MACDRLVYLSCYEIVISIRMRMAASRTVENTDSNLVSSALFNRTTADTLSAYGFSSINYTAADADMPLPNPNTPIPINADHTGGGQSDAAGDNRATRNLCCSNNMEYDINQRYRFNVSCHKNLRTLQQTIREKQRPCLFDAARIFGGTECASEVFNGICLFHWTMINLRVGVCERYNTAAKANGSYQHYEMVVDVPIPDRAIVPVFPNVTDNTSLWDLMFGFTFATNRGLATTKLNEGAAMAYALYYMMDNHCRLEFLAKSSYWIQNMTEYLMAFIFYNDELLKDVYASRFPLEQDVTDLKKRSVLKNVFTKHIYIQDLTFDVDTPKIQLPVGWETLLSERDVRLVRNLPPLSNDGTADNGKNLQPVSGGKKSHRSMQYRQFHIFAAPLILSLRASSYVNDMFVYGAPPVIGVFNISFKDSPKPHSVFGIQGPIQYGVALNQASRNLPFTTDMPVCTQAYVATLGGVSNVDVNEDRIFASELARYAEFNIPDSDRLFTV